jgi:SAM-dependent methyltransferase
MASIEAIARKIIPNLRFLPQSKLRMCRCCNQRSIIVSFSEGEEAKICIRCRANLRYEMLADAIRSFGDALKEMTVLELDSRSPLRPLLANAKTYYRSFFSDRECLGSLDSHGVRCEDITRLTFPSSSIDLIVSSDVLEHVPDIEAAFNECYRVLRPGGCHLFTVPPRSTTRRRAEVVNGKIEFLEKAEYHSDPLNRDGILAFWDFGPDAGDLFSSPGLNVSIVSGPAGKDQRVVWKAAKPRL